MLYFYIYFLIGKYLGENILIYLIIKKEYIKQTNCRWLMKNNLKNLHSMVKIKNYNVWYKILSRTQTINCYYYSCV